MIASRHSRSASTILVTLVTLTALSLLAAYTLTRVSPRIRMAYQNAAWQEARVAAEAGVDTAMNDLLINATGFQSGTWIGWKEDPPPKGAVKEASILQKLVTAPISKVNSLLAKLTKTQPKNGTAPDNSTTSTAPIYLDNLRISAVSGVRAEVDVRLWALQPNASPHTNWFRIRSTATCALPPMAFGVPANGDALLRRFSLREVRPSLRKENAGAPSTIPLPSITRTVEVLVEPILPFELALWTGRSVSLGATGAWNIDSFDSTDDAKSASGMYPGRGSPQTQANGSVATGQPRTFDTLYGPLIAANGTPIQGAVATNGGDDPATEDHENISGGRGVDPARVRDDFSREMPVIQRPPATTPLPPHASGSFVPGTEAAPAVYVVPGTLSQLRIAAPADKTVMGAIVVMIDGDLDLAGPLILPPAVVAVLYVRGNITFRDNVNAGPWNSNRATQLLIFADGSAHQRLQAMGATSICAAFYGPLVDASLEGTVNWIGSLAASSFQVNSGGDGGIHYDEALATVGPPVSFRISRYVEDVRE